jgi:hypothetical protein
MGRFSGIGRTLSAVALLWLMIGGFLLLQLWPELPHSTAQWLAFVALGPPLYLLGEGFFTWLFSRGHGEAISSSGFSVRRIAIALPAVLFVFIVCGWLSWLISRP